MRRFSPAQPAAGELADGERYAAIFCRNVMIYFDKPAQRVMLEPRAGGV